MSCAVSAMQSTVWRFACDHPYCPGTLTANESWGRLADALGRADWIETADGQDYCPDHWVPCGACDRPTPVHQTWIDFDGEGVFYCLPCADIIRNAGRPT